VYIFSVHIKMQHKEEGAEGGLCLVTRMPREQSYSQLVSSRRRKSVV
jgi:hypothetical protein